MADATINLSLFDGRRQLLPADADVRIHLTDGNLKERIIRGKGPTYRLKVAFTDGPKDRYIVFATADGYESAGFYPVQVNAAIESTVALMLVPNNASFNFADSQWSLLSDDLRTFLSAGTDSTTARTRYEQLLESDGQSLACLFNIVTAMRDMTFAPFSFFRQLIWPGDAAPIPTLPPRKDRFFAYVDSGLIDVVKKAVIDGTFEKEPEADLSLHPGATSSYKQIEFGQANVQLTFHETAPVPTGVPAGQKWVLVEPDIDFYKDLDAHTIDEVIPGFFSLTDPKGVYVLRWIAAKQARRTDFNPPYVLV